MFGSQALRLLRESWPNPQLLAEELYAMFQDSVPLESSAPLTLTQTGSVPALTIQSSGPPGADVIQFQNGNGVVVGGITIGDGQLNGNQGITIGPTTVGGININNPSNIDFSPGQGVTTVGQKQAAQSASGGSGNAFTGTVQSGSGNSYSVALSNGTTVTVTQLQIDPTDTIPAGTAVVVVGRQSGGQTIYEMQAPVWL
jgi:hypothetical protein